jgi:hypothetical protein
VKVKRESMQADKNAALRLHCPPDLYLFTHQRTYGAESVKTQTPQIRLNQHICQDTVKTKPINYAKNTLFVVTYFSLKQWN